MLSSVSLKIDLKELSVNCLFTNMCGVYYPIMGIVSDKGGEMS